MPEKKTKEQVMEEMDLAAANAHQELDKLFESFEESANLEPMAVIKALANWWEKHYRDAGHKRLARMLLEYAEKKER